MDTGCQSRSYCDLANARLHTSLWSPTPPPAPPPPRLFFPLLPILASSAGPSHFHCPSRFSLFLSCDRAVSVTVGCAASCSLSPRAPGCGRRNYYISCPLLCVRPPTSLALSGRSFLSADRSSSALFQMLSRTLSVCFHIWRTGCKRFFLNILHSHI